MKNVFQTEEGDSKRSFENSFKININVKSFEDNKVNRSYFNFNPELFKDYLDIVQQLQTKNYTSMTFPGETPNSLQQQINFYGKDGVISIAKQLEEKIQNMEHFIEEVYCSQILLSIVNNNNGKSNKQYAISFEGQNNLEEKHQYYNYLGKLFYELHKYCDEFLVHAVDVEGKAKGIEVDVVKILGNLENIKVTYAGGISSYEDIDLLKMHSKAMC